MIIPGDHAILIGSTGREPFVQDPDSLAKLYTSAKISSEYFSKYIFEEKMLPERIKYITNTLESVQDYRVNTDADPATYYFDLLLWNRLLQGDNRIFSSITRGNLFTTGTLAALILFIIIIVRRRQVKKMERFAYAITISCAGFIGITINLLFILNFQETFGSVYELIGALSAVFLLGSALGAIYIGRMSKKHKIKFILFVILTVLAGILLLFPHLLYILLKAHSMPLTLTAAMMCGGLIGTLFGITNRLYSCDTADIGSVYAYDVIGSSVGALFACSLLLPVLGIQEMTVFLSIVLLPAIYAAMLIQK